EATSLICRSVRRLGIAPGPRSGQSRLAALLRTGKQLSAPLRSKANAMRFQRGTRADKDCRSRVATATVAAVRTILHLQQSLIGQHTATSDLGVDKGSSAVTCHASELDASCWMADCC